MQIKTLDPWRGGETLFPPSVCRVLADQSWAEGNVLSHAGVKGSAGNLLVAACF